MSHQPLTVRLGSLHHYHCYAVVKFFRSFYHAKMRISSSIFGLSIAEKGSHSSAEVSHTYVFLKRFLETSFMLFCMTRFQTWFLFQTRAGISNNKIVVLCIGLLFIGIVIRTDICIAIGIVCFAIIGIPKLKTQYRDILYLIHSAILPATGEFPR